ncbi:MAG: TIGR03936 family radical SAM-associated protein, partial [Spirochaetes bacterium]|nr:TIGR03936 family radical SAM-associated protein [Spirochaetota bacterium]
MIENSSANGDADCRDDRRRQFIDIKQELGGRLLEVEKPARYAGGEFGCLAKKDAPFQALIAFPDLYEIGMSNQAFRIIYNRLNRIEGVSCDRAFAPAPDFEKLLREKKLPLYGLDTGIALGSVDLLMFTLGFELGLNGVLAMLDTAGISLFSKDRDGRQPIVLAGGPAVSNPLPYSPFIDAFWIGEAEGGFFEFASELAEWKARGEGRAAMLEKIASHPNVWVKGKTLARRAIDTGFSGAGEGRADEAEAVAEADVLPIPNLKTVQHHGVLEIMRGCPNGCRFCMAGFWYRPARQKSASQVLAEAEAIVKTGGWREISLSSLSSGDYAGIDNLVDELNGRFARRRVSFQLPSLKVSSFSLSLLEKISQTRKSGLTFAVETPVQAWQMSINKEAAKESVIEIIREAKKRGWKKAKFYFMIGLPASAGSGGENEEEEIAGFISDVSRATGMRFNVNIGLFVPKPHTPYQRLAQLDEKTALSKLNYIKQRLKTLGHKVNVSDTLLSTIEGLLSRGGEESGLLALEAYRAGSRLDPWDEYINRDAWRGLLEANRGLVDKTLGEKSPNEALPWDIVDSRVSPAYLRREMERSQASVLTPPCKGASCGGSPCQGSPCDDFCGVCGKRDKAEFSAKNTDVTRQEDTVYAKNAVNPENMTVYRVLFSFSKGGVAVFTGHLSLIEVFSMAFSRAGLEVLYTGGFNPLAKIEFAAPLATGVFGAGEIAAADFAASIDAASFAEKLNRSLPAGIRIESAATYCIPSGAKKHSLASLLWGFAYGFADGRAVAPVYARAAEEKALRQRLVEEALAGGQQDASP